MGRQPNVETLGYFQMSLRDTIADGEHEKHRRQFSDRFRPFPCSYFDSTAA